eukprot:TRINITY_DN101143_c0_g1_i1.p1 TRINITY_DN101143_c0_g1~~TRINITY_DN101143_c0_g1_i1.p1  ORF type:complete len:179 (-),score=17.20 TRINITY_DN101143_c0_g1_i1:29-565(-)
MSLNTRFTQILPVRPPIALGLWVKHVWLSKPLAFQPGFSMVLTSRAQEEAVDAILKQPMDRELLTKTVPELVGMRARLGVPLAIEEVLESVSLDPSCQLTYSFSRSGLAPWFITDLVGKVAFEEPSVGNGGKDETSMVWNMEYSVSRFVPGQAGDALFQTVIPIFLKRLEEASCKYSE